MCAQSPHSRGEHRLHWHLEVSASHTSGRSCKKSSHNAFAAEASITSTKIDCCVSPQISHGAAFAVAKSLGVRSIGSSSCVPRSTVRVFRGRSWSWATTCASTMEFWLISTQTHSLPAQWPALDCTTHASRKAMATCSCRTPKCSRSTTRSFGHRKTRPRLQNGQRVVDAGDGF